MQQCPREVPEHGIPPPCNREDKKTQITDVQRCHLPIAEPEPRPRQS
jgi:hypothetical protein